MADESARSGENATPSPPVLPPSGGVGIIVLAIVLMIAVLVAAWLVLGRHRDDLRQVNVIERAQ